MRVDRQKIAKVFDAMADYIEESEQAKAASVNAEREARVDKLAEAYASVQGEQLPDDMRKKLAAGDSSVFAFVENLVSKQAGVVEPLGAPSTDHDQPATTVKEAADAAGDRLVNWCVS